jgi:Na+-translocating ferredoxin:NAD+ oxidoreductase RnfD subunit
MNKANLGLYLHVFSQLIYVAVSFIYLGQERPPILFLSMVLMTLFLEFALRKILNLPGRFSVAALAVCNSVYLNMEGYGTLYWGFHLTLLVAMFSRLVLRPHGQPIFNPSMIGIFVAMLVFPEFVSFNVDLWQSNYNILLVLGLGLITTYYSGTLILCVTHLFGISIGGALVSVLTNTPFLSWPISTLTFGYLIYSFHVIGDPATSPRSLRGQVFFGFILAFFVVATRVLNFSGGYIVSYVLCNLGYAFWKNHRFLQKTRINAVKPAA